MTESVERISPMERIVHEGEDADDAVPPGATGLLRIDLGAVRTNYKALSQASGAATCAGVVKADAYGLGVKPVARALHEEGCRTFFVATPSEARTVRAVLPSAELYVLDGFVPGSESVYEVTNAKPVIGSIEEAKDWAAFSTRLESSEAALHVDTGMRRLGMQKAEVQAFSNTPSLREGFDVALVMSHLACGDTPKHPLNASQLVEFNAAREILPDAPASLANSAGTLLGKRFHYDLVRPGIALYGAAAIEGVPNPMRPTVSLKARVLQLRTLEPGETVGYGASFTAQRTSRLATVAAGYADGFSRHLSSNGDAPVAQVYFEGRAAPVVGRVSMDLITVDVTDLDEGSVKRGDWAQVIGGANTVDVLAEKAGTIGYEVLTRLGHRFHRAYVD